MTEKQEKAAELYRNEGNAAKAVITVFADAANIDGAQIAPLVEHAEKKAELAGKCLALCAAEIIIEEKFKSEGSAGFIAELEKFFFDKYNSLNPVDEGEQHICNVVDFLEETFSSP